jgi:hypothetical protein
MIPGVISVAIIHGRTLCRPEPQPSTPTDPHFNPSLIKSVQFPFIRSFGMRTITSALFLCLQVSLVYAEDISPWFGSADQKPFRLETNMAEALSTDQTTTNSTEPAPCEIAGCPKDGKTAITTGDQGGLSQN